jgi:hypothetical protein
MPTETDEQLEPSPEVIRLSRFDARSLWRVTFWGSAAALALVLVGGTAFSDAGAERLKLVLASMIEPVKGPPPGAVALQRTAELEKQTQQLSEMVRRLTNEREILNGRIAILEQNVEDVTGAIKRQAAQPAQQPQQTQAAATPSPVPPPTVSAPPTTTASIATPPSQPPAPATPAPVASAPEAATPSANPVPLPPTRTANAAPPPVSSDPPPEPVLRRELGVDLGGAGTLEALRAHWATIKANIGPDIVGMRASYAQRTKTSGAVDYRLVVGPFPNTAAAIRLCSKLTPMHLTCRAGVFNVQQLAEKQPELPR